MQEGVAVAWKQLVNTQQSWVPVSFKPVRRRFSQTSRTGKKRMCLKQTRPLIEKMLGMDKMWQWGCGRQSVLM